MKSIDTNILFYAILEDVPEHPACMEFIESALVQPGEWIIADQIWFELYRLLRNPFVLKKPLSAAVAASAIDWYRNQTGWLHCAWQPTHYNTLQDRWSQPRFAQRNVFDTILGLTLLSHGVKHFYTRNIKDFSGLGFEKIIDPTNRGG